VIPTTPNNVSNSRTVISTIPAWSLLLVDFIAFTRSSQFFNGLREKYAASPPRQRGGD
jgi:hypothetical protein